MSESQEAAQSAQSEQPVSVEEVVEASQEIDPNAPPKELLELRDTLGKIANHKSVVDNGNFPGRLHAQVGECKEFLNDLYLQVFEQFNNHPFMVALREKQEADAAKAAAEAEVNVEMEYAGQSDDEASAEESSSEG